MSLKQTVWMYPNNVYVTSGGACANSLLFEDQYCHLPAERITSILQASQLFFKYLNRFVTPMAEVLHYKLNSTEWALLIRIRSEDEISNAYFKQRNKSRRADREKDFTETCRMLSEHFRMFLSNFATCLL